MRRFISRLSLVLPIALVAVGSLQLPVTAQEATPVAECTVAPRTLAGIAEIIPTSPAADATPLAQSSSYTRPDGTPADAATTAGVEATVAQLAACANAGDYLRFLALFSDAALRRYAVELGLPLDPDDALLTPDPDADDHHTVSTIEDVLVLADGRINALVHLTNQTGSGTSSDLSLQVIVVQSDDRWLIDELMPITPSAPTAWAPVSGDGYRGVIVDAASAPGFAQLLIGSADVTGWEPTADDIGRVEAGLAAFIKTAPNAAPDLWQRLPNYLRQYAGVIDSDGRQLILVNAFCDPVGSDWQTQPVFVLDGGDCFFSVRYDVDARTFSGLLINGEA